MSRRVPRSSGSTTEKLALSEEDAGITALLCCGPTRAEWRAEEAEACRRAPAMRACRSCRGPLGKLSEREDAGHGGAAADSRIERYRATVQLDERAHQRQAKPGAASPASSSRTNPTPCPSRPPECRALDR